MSDADKSADSPPRGITRTSRWPGWIWAVPIAAVAIVAWLGIRAWASSGPEVTVTFPVIANIKPDDTKVTFQGLEVGRVSAVHVGKDLRHTRVTLDLHDDMAGHLGKGTQFWIGGRSISFGNLSDLKSILSGAYIGIDPKPGAKQSSYVGLGDAPVVKFGATGTSFRLQAPRLGAVARDTAIYYRDQQVGRVISTQMQDGSGFAIEVFIDAPYDKLVHANSRFWSAGAVRLSSGSSGPAVQFQSIPALFEGAIAFETPAGARTEGAANPDQQFTLYDSRDAAAFAPGADGVAYRVAFATASGPLAPNAAVTLMGTRIGSVTATKLRYDPASGTLGIDATIVLEPDPITLAGGAAWSDPRTQMDALMRHLVAQGLHAALTASPPVIGGQSVELRIVPGQPGTLGAGPIPEIPTTSGSDIAGIMATASDIATKVDQIPIAQIGDNVHDTTDRMAELAKSPQVAQTLRNVDAATANVASVTADARRQLPATLAHVREAVDAAQGTLAAAHSTLSAQGGAAGQPGTEGLPETLYEVDQAARSLRELSDFLDRHPAALLRGRGGAQ